MLPVPRFWVGERWPPAGGSGNLRFSKERASSRQSSSREGCRQVCTSFNGLDGSVQGSQNDSSWDTPSVHTDLMSCDYLRGLSLRDLRLLSRSKPSVLSESPHSHVRVTAPLTPGMTPLLGNIGSKRGLLTQPPTRVLKSSALSSRKTE